MMCHKKFRIGQKKVLYARFSARWSRLLQSWSRLPQSWGRPQLQPSRLPQSRQNIAFWHSLGVDSLSLGVDSRSPGVDSNFSRVDSHRADRTLFSGTVLESTPAILEPTPAVLESTPPLLEPTPPLFLQLETSTMQHLGSPHTLTISHLETLGVSSSILGSSSLCASTTT